MQLFFFPGEVAYLQSCVGDFGESGGLFYEAAQDSSPSFYHLIEEQSPVRPFPDYLGFQLASLQLKGLRYAALEGIPKGGLHDFIHLALGIGQPHQQEILRGAHRQSHSLYV